MWKVLELDSLTGTWNEHGKFSTSEECRAGLANFANQAGNFYAFWDGSLPKDLVEQNRLFDEIFSINNGKINRITIGLDLGLAKKIDTQSECPGRCFCVVAHGMRRCETYYCNVNNVCAWVPCGMGC